MLNVIGYAQRHEFGVGVGGFNYAGDLMRGYHIDNIKPGLVGYYKMNFDNIVSVRAGLTGGIISSIFHCTSSGCSSRSVIQRCGSVHG